MSRSRSGGKAGFAGFGFAVGNSGQAVARARTLSNPAFATASLVMRGS